MKTEVVLGSLAFLLAAPVLAQDAAEPELDEAALELSFMEEQNPLRTKLYGFIDAYWEKVGRTPAGVDEDDATLLESNPAEFDVPNLNLMVQSRYGDRLGAYLNLAAPGADHVEVRNAWVEANLYGQLFTIRAGKLYRPFGLYNELLDAVPTYMGIEPPEMLDNDHLLMTRTTNLMLRGELMLAENLLSYALTTGNDERKGDQVPLGADLHFKYGELITVGASFYSTMGAAAPHFAEEDAHGHAIGQSAGGVEAWMTGDRYYALGGYAELRWGGLTVQVEHWQSRHDAKRDPDHILELLGEAGLNDRQRERFGVDGLAPTADDVIVDAEYVVLTAYVRAGYNLETDFGELTPYVQYDYYENPETIANKHFGGDNEAGLADDGRFHKATAGFVFRPVPLLAFKLDGSAHFQQYNDYLNIYPEIRASLSYLWSL